MALLGGVAAIVLWAPTALAQDGAAGLYEPFPPKARTKAAKAFVRQLPLADRGLTRGLEASGRQLDSGRIVRAGGLETLRSPLPGPASVRGGVTGNGEPSLPTALALVLLAAGLGAAGLRSRRT